MPKLACTLILFCTLLCFQDVFCRSINIDYSHKYNFASSDVYEEQESVNLKELEIKIRSELEKTLKQYQEQLKVVNFEIPTTDVETEDDIRDRNNPTIHHILGIAVPATTEKTNPATEKTNPVIHTSLSPTEAGVHSRLKRRAKSENPGFENAPDKPIEEKTNAAIEKVESLMVERTFIYAAYVIVGLVFVCCMGTFCFITGPRQCFLAIIASPCLLIMCPCTLSYISEYLHPESILAGNAYAYVPGIMVHSNGRLQRYKPSPDEIEAVREIIDIMREMD